MPSRRSFRVPGRAAAARTFGTAQRRPGWSKTFERARTDPDEVGRDRGGYAVAHNPLNTWEHPSFFWYMVRPYIDDGLRYLGMTQNGKQWMANLYAHVFAEEHDLPSLGPERATAVA